MNLKKEIGMYKAILVLALLTSAPALAQDLSLLNVRADSQKSQAVRADWILPDYSKKIEIDLRVILKKSRTHAAKKPADQATMVAQDLTAK